MVKNQVHLTWFSIVSLCMMAACVLVEPEQAIIEPETVPVLTATQASIPQDEAPLHAQVTAPPTAEPDATAQPQDGPPMTMPQLDLPENFPDPDHLTDDGLRAYQNLLPILLSEDEINPLFNSEKRTWEFNFDDPGLYRTCRVFVNFHHFLEQYFYFFSCVYQMVPDFDLMTGDPGFYEVLEVYPTVYEMAVPSAVVRYRSTLGFDGIDRVFQVGQFVYISGIWADVNTTDDLFTDFIDGFLFETATLMYQKAVTTPPEALVFPEGAVSEKVPDYAGVLVRDGDLSEWGTGEPDSHYPDGQCRMMYRDNGPPPVLVNCAFRISAAAFNNWLSYQMQGDYIDITHQTRFMYESSYAMFINWTEGGYPRIAFAIFSGDLILTVEVISPFLKTGVELSDVFTEDVDRLVHEVILLNLSRQQEN